MSTKKLLIVGMPVGLALVVGGALIYLFFFMPVSKDSSRSDNPLLAGGTVLPERDDAITQISPTTSRYWNNRYFFTLEYPTELKVTEVDEGGATTIIFQKPGEQIGFQMFIVRYRDEEITEQRIQKDLGGAPMRNVKEIILPGGIRALHFESESPLIGSSVEVWFIDKGYLYEVTAYAPLDSWLAGILSTLKFDGK